MDCKEIRELLSAYLDNMLEESEKKIVEQHLENCSACSQELADLRKTIDVVKSLGEVLPPKEFHDNLVQRVKNVHQEEQGLPVSTKKGFNLFRKKVKSRWIAAAAVLIVGMGIGVLADNLLNPGAFMMGSSADTAKHAEVENSEVESNNQVAYGDSGAKTTDDNKIKYKTSDSSTSNLDNPDNGFQQSEVQEAPEETNSINGLTDEELARKQAAPDGKGGTFNQGAQMFSVAGRPDETGDAKANIEESKADGQVTSIEPNVAEGTIDKQPTDNAAAPENAVAPDDTGVPQKAPEIDKAEVRNTTVPNGTKIADNDIETDKANAANTSVSEEASNTSSPAYIIKNGWFTVEVKDFNKASREIESLASRYGGYIESSEQHMQGQQVGNFVIRVPVKNFDAAITNVEKIGKVASKKLSGEDVSMEYQDANARLRNLRTQETRLLTLVNKADQLGDVLALETELNRVREEIEKIEGRINYLSNLTEMATINLEVIEVEEKNTPGPEGLFKRTWNAFVDSWQGLINLLERIIIFAGGLLPYILLLAGGVIGYKAYKKRSGK